VLKKKKKLDAFLSTKVKCAALRFRNFRFEGRNCSMLDVATFISGKLAKNINEKFMTVIFSNVSRMFNSVTDCDLSIQAMPYMVEGGAFDGMEIVVYRLSWFAFY
jgi:hypothetical protein